MTQTQTQEYQFPLLPDEALRYLAENGVVYKNVANLRVLRSRGKAQSNGVKKRTTLWEKAELDAILEQKRVKKSRTSEQDKALLDKLVGEQAAQPQAGSTLSVASATGQHGAGRSMLTTRRRPYAGLPSWLMPKFGDEDDVPDEEKPDLDLVRPRSLVAV